MKRSHRSGATVMQRLVSSLVHPWFPLFSLNEPGLCLFVYSEKQNDVNQKKRIILMNRLASTLFISRINEIW